MFFGPLAGAFLAILLLLPEGSCQGAMEILGRPPAGDIWRVFLLVFVFSSLNYRTVTNYGYTSKLVSAVFLVGTCAALLHGSNRNPGLLVSWFVTAYAAVLDSTKGSPALWAHIALTPVVMGCFAGWTPGFFAVPAAVAIVIMISGAFFPNSQSYSRRSKYFTIAGSGLLIAAVLTWLAPVISVLPVPSVSRVFLADASGSAGPAWTGNLRGHFPGNPSHERGYGELAALIESSGYRLILDFDGIEPADLLSCDAVIILPGANPPGAESAASIRSFVEAGGGALLVADHTGAGMEAVNSIASAWGIKVSFDTVWHDQTSMGPLRISGPPLFQPGRRPYWGTGAGLLLDGRASALISTPSCGWRDGGNRDDLQTGIGDGVKNPDESYESIPLAAFAAPGKGSTIVLGDTGCLQNGGIFLNPLPAASIIRRIGSPGLSCFVYPWIWVVAATIGFLLILTPAAACDNYEPTSSPWSGIVIASAFFCWMTFFGDLAVSNQFFPPPDSRLDLAAVSVRISVDSANEGRTYADCRNSDSMNLDTFMVQAIRCGAGVSLLQTGDPLPRPPALLVIAGPRAQFSRDRIKEISHFVNFGGILVIIPAVDSEIDRTGDILGIVGMAIGQFPVAAMAPQRSLEGLPVRYDPRVRAAIPLQPASLTTEVSSPGSKNRTGSALPGFMISKDLVWTDFPRAVFGGTAILTDLESHVPIAAIQRSGIGWVAVFGDPWFFSNRSLRRGDRYVDIPKHEIIRRLIDLAVDYGSGALK